MVITETVDDAETPDAPAIIQLVLGTDNLPFCASLYRDVFGFAEAGERLVYSAHNGEVMALGPIGGAMVAYLVGRQELMQLEFWSHTTPPQRPLSADWRSNDIGFCRFGISVSDFDATIGRLRASGVDTLAEPTLLDGLRRVSFRDPTIGIPVEILEDGPGLPGQRDRYHELDPAIVYVAVSVTDLADAVSFFTDVVGLEKVSVELHTPGDEASWGLPDARRKSQVLLGGTTYLELVEYERPAGRPRPLDDPLNAQGFTTVGVGFRNPVSTGRIFDRVKASGLSWTVQEPASFVGGNHVVGAVAHHLKTLSVPHELERQFGYAPRQQDWWRPPRPASGTAQQDELAHDWKEK